MNRLRGNSVFNAMHAAHRQLKAQPDAASFNAGGQQLFEKSSHLTWLTALAGAAKWGKT